MARTQRNASAKEKDVVKIRRARKSDAERIAELCGQLGYPATATQIAQRLRRIKPASQHAVLVAETSEGKVIGWVHASVEPLLEVELRAEVNGLVVADEERSRGAGALLLRSAEEWARRHGCKNMSVRSNVVRERAHKFYLRNGYEHYKTQKSFRKAV
jgi:GNAT superfamily N-acetyltransferase